MIRVPSLVVVSVGRLVRSELGYSNSSDTPCAEDVMNPRLFEIVHCGAHEKCWASARDGGKKPGVTSRQARPKTSHHEVRPGTPANKRTAKHTHVPRTLHCQWKQDACIRLSSDANYIMLV